MRALRLLALCSLAWLVGSLSARAADLSKMDRTIAKEPAYATKSPVYCLMVFGHEARTRVWLVLDGDTLYVDRNGNGDLTEEKERVQTKPFGESHYVRYAQERRFDAGEIHDGKLTHTDLTVTQWRGPMEPPLKTGGSPAKVPNKKINLDEVAFSIHIVVEVRPRPGDGVRIAGRINQFAGEDAQGVLQFTARSRDAPVVHFGGPLQMALQARQELTRGDQTGDLETMIGTPGIGTGTFASVGYAGLISGDVHPKAEIEFPPKVPGGPPLKNMVALTHRC